MEITVCVRTCVCVLGLSDIVVIVTIIIKIVTITIAITKIAIAQMITPPLPHEKTVWR